MTSPSTSCSRRSMSKRTRLALDSKTPPSFLRRSTPGGDDHHPLLVDETHVLGSPGGIPERIENLAAGCGEEVDAHVSERARRADDVAGGYEAHAVAAAGSGRGDRKVAFVHHLGFAEAIQADRILFEVAERDATATVERNQVRDDGFFRVVGGDRALDRGAASLEVESNLEHSHADEVRGQQMVFIEEPNGRDGGDSGTTADVQVAKAAAIRYLQGNRQGRFRVANRARAKRLASHLQHAACSVAPLPRGKRVRAGRPNASNGVDFVQGSPRGVTLPSFMLACQIEPDHAGLLANDRSRLRAPPVPDVRPVVGDGTGQRIA